jgi:uncharacterized iron-regulated protein
MTMRGVARGLVAFLALSAATLAARAVEPSPRVLSTATGTFVDVDTMVADLAGADVVFLGDPAARTRLVAPAELAIVRGLSTRRGASLVLALGRFGRDVQEPFDHFSMGHIGDEELTASTGPWSDDQAGHRPVIDFVGRQGQAIVAANAARRLVAEVAGSGLAALGAHGADQAWFARERQCDARGPEFARFTASRARAEASTSAHAYAAACLEEETIAESIVQAASIGAAGGTRSFVVSLNDASHSDYRAGAVARTHRRLPDARLAVVSFEVADRLDDAVAPPDAAARADYVVYVPQP